MALPRSTQLDLTPKILASQMLTRSYSVPQVFLPNGLVRTFYRISVAAHQNSSVISFSGAVSLFPPGAYLKGNPLSGFLIYW